MRQASLVPAVYVLVKNQSGQGLFLRRFNTGYADGLLTLPSGHAELNEGIVAAACRELQEETGLLCTESDLQLVHCMRRPVTQTQAYVDFYFMASHWSGEPSLREPDKSSEWGWFDIVATPLDVIPHVVAALRSIQQSQLMSEWLATIEP